MEPSKKPTKHDRNSTTIRSHHPYILCCFAKCTLCLFVIEQSNRTPRCSQEVSAAGLPWLEHSRVQCYTQVKCLLVGIRKAKFTAANLQYGVHAGFSTASDECVCYLVNRRQWQSHSQDFRVRCLQFGVHAGFSSASDERARPEGEAKALGGQSGGYVVHGFVSMESEVCCGWLQRMLLVLIMAGRCSGFCMQVWGW